MSVMGWFRTYLIAGLTLCLLNACSGQSSTTTTNNAPSETDDPNEPSGDTKLDLAFIKKCVSDANPDKECPTDLQLEEVQKAAEAPPIDILFVLDESCSMQTIANNVRDGFASLTNGAFPDDTQMGVTYMSPAALDSMGQPIFNTPWKTGNVVPSFPGFLRLITEATQTEYTTQFPANARYFPKKACANEWFHPSDKNARGEACLDAAVQLGNWCTGAETGLVAFEQLLLKSTLGGKRLFREGAFANVIFVSDTHEPGDNYFGLPAAPEGMKNFEDILGVVAQNSPGVASLKLSGIVPLPVVGDPIYSNLNVIGAIPQNAAEAKIGNELFHEYSYLNIISQAGGVASHAKSSNWRGVAQSLVDSSNKTGTIFVELTQTPDKVFFVLINGEVVPKHLIKISKANKSLIIKKPGLDATGLKIEVFYN